MIAAATDDDVVQPYGGKTAAAASAATGGRATSETDSIGREFARKYYDAFVAEIDADSGEEGLDRFHNDRSKYVFMRHGRLADLAVRGASAIGRFVARMHNRGPGRTTVDVGSVDTLRVRRDRFAVLTVGQLTRWPPERSRSFVQCTVFEHAAGDRFAVVGTVFKFDDRVIDPLPDADDGDSPERPVPELLDCGRSKTVARREEVAGRREEVAGRREESAAGTTDVASTSYDGGVKMKSDHCTTTSWLYVGGLSDGVTADDLTAAFGRFGALAAVTVRACRKRGASKPRRYGMVQFVDAATVDAVAEHGTVSLANGDTVIVEKSIKR